MARALGGMNLWQAKKSGMAFTSHGQVDIGQSKKPGRFSKTLEIYTPWLPSNENMGCILPRNTYFFEHFLGQSKPGCFIPRLL
jgi:hypothetical protein